MMNRRSMLRSLFLAPEPKGKTLIVIFLRGGADGLNMVVPHFEEEYYSLRPTLSIGRPDQDGGCIDLDGRFGLHPSLKPLLPLYQDGRMAIVHAAGSDDQTRSHFEAQDLMERAGRYQDGVTGGWLARHLRSRPGAAPTSLSAVAISTGIPESLRGTGAAAIASLADLSLAPRSRNAAAVESTLEALYAGEGDPIIDAGRETLGVLRRLKGIEPEKDPGSGLRHQLSQLASLINADVGLEVGCIDYGGWDTHFVQGTTLGLHASLCDELAKELGGFCEKLGPRLKETYIVVQTEFGRRTYENGSLGTDHGRGGVMFLLGESIRGGRVVTEWPGLGEEAREGPGDLAVTIDYRDVLAEVLDRGLGNSRMDKVFRGHTVRYQGLVS